VASEPLRIAIHGAAGRMGTRLVQLIAEDPALTLASAIERPDHPRLGEDVGPPAGLPSLGVPLTAELAGRPDAAIDFSSPRPGLTFARACAADGVPLVVGTTGFEPEDRRALEQLAETIPLFIAANFSKAVYLLTKLVAEAAGVLGEAADIEIVERHHRFKVDAPSGTALRLAEAAAEARGGARFVHGRQGQTGQRARDEIGIHALRCGDNPGEHTVVFGLLGESLELSHRALNRDGFARGALDAAKFLAGKPPGLYALRDLLGF
jgi:4-hydroxy-tetrahydrodipicolinate reductase